jgi:hypothetical protein
VVYRTARCGLRVTRAQRGRLFGLLRSAGDVWCAVLELNRWRHRHQDAPLAGYQELCRQLAASGPGTFGEPLLARLDRDLPYPAGQVRSVTLGFDAGRLYLDVTAEVPVATYPEGTGPDPARVAGVDLGIIHPYAVAGPAGQQLLVSGRAIRAECRQHLRDRKGRTRAAARRAPAPGSAPSPCLLRARGSRTAEPGATCQVCTRPDVTPGDGPHHGRPPRGPWPAPARPQRQPPNGESLATPRGARKPPANPRRTYRQVH